MATKVEKTEKLINKLRKIAENGIKNKTYDIALSAISSAAGILYEYNQFYSDSQFENMLLRIGEEAFPQCNYINAFQKHERRVFLFYDGFGLDLRGTAIGTLNMLMNLNYKIVYVTTLQAKGKQPILQGQLAKSDVETIYIDYDKSYLEAAKNILDTFIKYEPDSAIFYSTPNDVSGIIAFNLMSGFTDRFFSDLTDHAFWLGVNTFDYILNNRDIGQSIEHNYRNIPTEKQIRTNGCPFVNHEIQIGKIPFDLSSHRFIYSGGALYKTLGDPELKFYKIARSALDHFEDLNFVYTGSGDDSEMQKLISDYPERVFLLPERNDFYQIIEKCTLYLSTYPFFGATMMRFCAMAGKIPLTLRNGNETEGILNRQSERKVEYDSCDELIKDMIRLLSDEKYLKEREKLLIGAVLSEEEVTNDYKKVFEQHSSKYEIKYIDVDKGAVQEEYLQRFDLSKARSNYLYKKVNRSIFKFFIDSPVYIAKKALNKLLKQGV